MSTGKHWILRLKERHESHFPDWQPWEGPRDNEHIRLFVLAKGDDGPPTTLWSVILDGHYVNEETLQQVLNENSKSTLEIRQGLTGKRIEFEDGGPTEPVTVATVSNMTQDEFVFAIRGLFPLSTKSNTLDWDWSTYVKLSKWSRARRIYRIVESEPVYREDWAGLL